MLMKPFHCVKLSLLLALLLLLFWGWISGVFQARPESGVFVAWPDYAHKYLQEALPVADSFVCPIHPPLGEGAYLFKAFGEENSTAEIWKLEPGSEERETPIVAMGDGLVLMAENWGSDLNGVVIVLHRTKDPERLLIESMCAGLDTIEVGPGQLVKKGDRLGVIFNARENALQWEVRETLGLGISPGNAEDRSGWLKPSEFLRTNGQSR
jgi:hypothetical protein